MNEGLENKYKAQGAATLINSGTTGKSPLEDIPYITADITTQEIVGLVRESRAGI
jgi:hypothetical protein